MYVDCLICWYTKIFYWTEVHPVCCVRSLSRVWLFATPRTVARQTLLSMGSSRQEYWSGLPFPSPGDLPNPGIEPRSPALQADTLTSELPGKGLLKILSFSSEVSTIVWHFIYYSLLLLISSSILGWNFRLNYTKLSPSLVNLDLRIFRL